ncbi:MAG: hypothetical protein RLZZ528_2183, partial [Pseudomonadota bacterium]
MGQGTAVKGTADLDRNTTRRVGAAKAMAQADLALRSPVLRVSPDKGDWVSRAKPRGSGRGALGTPQPDGRRRRRGRAR